nr:MAG TPA: hypothetical protein [Caudoviricetes sp.]
MNIEVIRKSILKSHKAAVRCRLFLLEELFYSDKSFREVSFKRLFLKNFIFLPYGGRAFYPKENQSHGVREL